MSAPEPSLLVMSAPEVCAQLQQAQLARHEQPQGPAGQLVVRQHRLRHAHLQA